MAFHGILRRARIWMLLLSRMVKRENLKANSARLEVARVKYRLLQALLDRATVIPFRIGRAARLNLSESRATVILATLCRATAPLEPTALERARALACQRRQMQ